MLSHGFESTALRPLPSRSGTAHTDHRLDSTQGLSLWCFNIVGGRDFDLPRHSHYPVLRGYPPMVYFQQGTSWPDLWESERSSSVACALQGARRKGRAQVDGKWRDSWEQLRPPRRASLQPHATKVAGRQCVKERTGD